MSSVSSTSQPWLLTGKTALVTGGSRGIGRAIAIHFARKGLNKIAITYASNSEAAEVTLDECRRLGVSKAIAIQAEITDPQFGPLVVQKALEGLDTTTIDILVNNACVGGMKYYRPVHETTPDIFLHLMHGNVYSAMSLTRECMAHFPPRGGRAINISSAASRLANPSPTFVHGAAKAALESITRSFAGAFGVATGATFTSVSVNNDAPRRMPEKPTLPSPAQPPRDLRWFLHPSTWNIAHHYEAPASFPSGPAVSNFIRGMQAWLVRFLRDGHNPFIHRLLYQAKTMPQCIQDAYAAIAVSQYVTPENEHMVDQMSFSLILSLLSSQPADGFLAFTTMSSKDHLARAHALLIHLLLALFSPSIPRRAEAESLIETLFRWTNQLWQSATQNTSISSLFQTTPPLEEGSEFCANLHELFVICESIRRTWILSNLATGVFHSLKGDWAAACAGDIHITTRAELWEAPSLARWEAIVSEKDPLFIHSLDGQSLVARGVHASDVDEFARHIFTIMWGMDKVEDGVERTRDGLSLRY